MIIEWSTFINLTQIQFFINFCNFYQRFIKNFSKIVHFMIQLTQKIIIFEWNQICQMMFNHMKKCIIKTLILHHFNQTCKTILEIDSFNYINDEVLSQYDDERTLHSVVFYSKNLFFVECNYEIYDKKLLSWAKHSNRYDALQNELESKVSYLKRFLSFRHWSEATSIIWQRRSRKKSRYCEKSSFSHLLKRMSATSQNHSYLWQSHSIHASQKMKWSRQSDE